MTVFGNGAIWIDQNQDAGAHSKLAGNADVLREYERYLSIIADDDKSMIFIDKKKI